MEEINQMLAQSIAKVDALDNEKKTPGKIENEVDITSFCPCTASVVYHYLQSVNPEVGKLFIGIIPDIDLHPNFTITDVVDDWKRKEKQKEMQMDWKKVKEDELKEKKGTIKSQKCGSRIVRKKASICYSKRPFTPEEDDLIRIRIEEFGDNVKSGKLAKELGRKNGSVFRRIQILKSGNVRGRHKLFSLLEDEAILKKVLPDLEKKNLKDIVVHESSFEDLAKDIGRSPLCVMERWVNILQPWIMQHEAGTLNLDIRQMLINHVSETYSERESIRWDVVAHRPEFAGHSEISLRRIFANNILPVVRRNDSKISKLDISLKQIADALDQYITEGKHRKISEKVRERQINVIEYYERFARSYGVNK